jgi:hypothetical protein
MDLSNLDTTAGANEGAILELRGPDGAPLRQADGSPVTLTLLGADSEQARKARNTATNRYLKTRGKVQITAEASEADGIAYLAKCTTAWSGIGIGQDETPFSYENAVKLYETFAFIREQADEFVAERANFLKASPKN